MNFQGSNPNGSAQNLSPTGNFYRAPPSAVNPPVVHPYSFPGGVMVFNNTQRVDVHLHFENLNPAQFFGDPWTSAGNAGGNGGFPTNNARVSNVNSFEENGRSGLNSVSTPDIARGTNNGEQNEWTDGSVFTFPSPPHSSAVSTGVTLTRGSPNPRSTLATKPPLPPKPLIRTVRTGTPPQI